MLRLTIVKDAKDKLSKFTKKVRKIADAVAVSEMEDELGARARGETPTEFFCAQLKKSVGWFTLWMVAGVLSKEGRDVTLSFTNRTIELRRENHAK